MPDLVNHYDQAIARGESYRRGQTFAKMANLCQFLGATYFWENCTQLQKSQYAGICFVSVATRTFSLEKWLDSEVIMDAWAEFEAERIAEAADPSNLEIEF